MKKQDPIDVEVTHVEENDELVELRQPDSADPDMTSGIAIVTPEQYIEQTPQRRQHRMPLQRQRTTEVAVTPSKDLVALVDLDQLDYDEDVDVLRIIYGKIFRTAIITGAALPEMPDIEAQVQATHGDLAEVFNDLDDARDGKTDLDWRLSEWKEALAR